MLQSPLGVSAIVRNRNERDGASRAYGSLEDGRAVRRIEAGSEEGVQHFGVDSPFHDGPREAPSRLSGQPGVKSRANDFLAVAILFVHFQDMGAETFSSAGVDEVT
jgi:hypothetical protein